MDAVPPARPVEMITQSASGAGQPWAPWKVALELASGLGAVSNAGICTEVAGKNCGVH